MTRVNAASIPVENAATELFDELSELKERVTALEKPKQPPAKR